MKSSPFLKRLSPILRLAFVLIFLGLEAGLPLNGILDSAQAAPVPETDSAPARDLEPAPAVETGVGKTGNPRPLMAAEASVSLGMPSDVMLGENFSFTVTFDNTSTTSTDVGYGPFIDLVFPLTGESEIAGEGGDDGIDYISADYLGNALEDDIQIFPDDGGGVGCVSHPWLRDNSGNYVDVCGDAGDKFVSLRLPFGSFVPDQPALDINVNASMSDYANLSTPAMVISARGGYMYGETALDDWCCGDTPFAEPNDTNSDNWPGSTVTPQVMTFAKSYVGPSNTQDETATGPNYIHQYQLTAEIAAGQTLTNLDITDLLPDNVQYVGINAATTAGYTITSEPSTSTPGGTLVLNYASAIGTVDVVFDFYIPRLYDDTGAGTTFDDAIISPTTGDDVNSENIAWAEGDWDPTDPDDAPETLSSDATCPTCPPLHTLEDKSIAIQKSVSVVGGGDPAPGKFLEYSLSFQVSDYFSFGDIVITDTISDGQHVRLASDFVPTLQVDGNSYTLATDDFNSANYDITCDYTGSTLTAPTECTILGGGGTGETTLTFRVSDEIINDGENGDMVGGCVDDGGAGLISPCDPANLGDGATTATLIFRTEIQEDFTNAYPSGDNSVDQGDHLDNTVSILGNVLDNSTFVAGLPEDDDATSRITIGRESLTKTIYAINDDDNPANWETDGSGNYIVSPGDKITYRLEYDLNTSDVEGLTFDDYFPLPVFDVDDPDQDGVSGPAWIFSNTVGIPAPGVVQRESADTFYDYMTAGLGGGTGTLTANTLNTGPTQNPVITSDADANKIVIAYADYDDTRNQSTKVDLLFSLIVSDDAFADGLFLTNMAHAYEGTTNGDDGTADAIIKFVIGEPVLVGTKGIVWTSNPSNVFSPATTGPGGVTFISPSDANNPPRWTGTINSNGLDANPIDSNVSGVDAGDTITFAITIENQGTSLKGAFDITLRDILDETFYQIPTGGINLQIYYGDGSGPITYQYNPSGGACTGSWPGDPCGPDGVSGTEDDIFGDGIRMDDPVGEGACQAHDPNLGNNIIMLTYDLQIKPDVEPGTGVNTVHLINYAGEEGGPNHLPEDQMDDSEATVDIPSIDKYLVDTSEADTTNSPLRLAIGEIVRYRLAVTIPEGSMPNFQLDDNLPGGLTYLDDGTARVGFIYNGVGITSSGYNDVPALGACLISGNSVGDIAGALPCALADLNVGRTTATSFSSGDDDDYVTSTDPQFKLGSIQNNDSDDDAELVVVEFNVLVDNHTGSGDNDLGERRRNNFDLYINIDGTRTGFGRSNNVDGRIEEPVIIDLAKTATPNTGDAGDTIAYQVTFSNSRSGGSTSYVATAFDVIFTDTVPAKMNNISARTLTFTPAACGVLTGDTLVGNDITLNFSTLDAGCQVTIDYTANLTTAVTPGETLTNSAQVLYTSLPGDKGTAPNPTGSTVEDGDGSDNTDEPGEINGERNGTGTNPPNDYVDTATAPVDVIFSATKTLVSTNLAGTVGSDLTIGEIARFRMVVQLGEGTSPGFIFTDNLPNGLQFIDDNSAKFAFVSNGPGISSSTLTCSNDNGNAADIISLPSANVDCDLTGAISGSPFNDGTDPIFSLGDLVNTDSDGDAEFVVLEFNARLVNAAAYQSGGSATNNFSVEIESVDRGTSNDVTVDFVEPVLNLTKTASADTDWLYGETVTYTLVIDHDATSNAPAYDIVVTDTVPSGLTYVGGSISAPAGWTPSASGADLTWTCTASPCSLPVSLTFQATVDAPPSASALDPSNSTATNTAYMTWTSLPGADATERDGSGSSGGDAWDDYHTSDSHTGELALVAIGNVVWLDTGAGANYNNGVFDGDEAGVNDVTVELYSVGPDGISGTADDVSHGSVDTSGGGFYEFDRLLPDTYFVYIPATEFDGGGTSTLTGYRSTTGNGTNEVDDHNFDENGIDVTDLATSGIRTPDYVLQRDGETTTDDETSYSGVLDDDNVNFTADFGFVELVAIGNRVWFDTGSGTDYNDGEFDTGETPVDNVTINLYTSTGTFVATVDTAGGGYYQFDDLLPGQYYVEIPAAEFQAGGDLFGYVSTTTTGNDETSDDGTDENGIDANVAVNGIRTRIYDLQPNAEIMLEDQSNYTGAWDDDNVNFTADLSFVRLVAIGNRVWLDTGAGGGILDNGIQEAGELGIDGVDVQLFHVGDIPGTDLPVATTTTATINGEAGSYEFDQLNPGDYFVHIPASEFAGGGTLAGYYSSTGNGSDETSDQNADENGIDTASLSTDGISTTAYTLDIGTETTADDQNTYTGYLDNANVNFTADFGFLQKVAIGNIVWLDNGAGTGVANNGIMDGTEVGISGVDLELYHTGNTPGVSPTVDTTTTDINGQYFFDDLLPGDYFIFIPATEFQSGGDLVNLRSSTGNGTDETTNENGDENGIDSASTPNITGIQSTDYTLQPNTEQTGEDQSNYTGSLVDGSVNFTADFGFTELVAIGNRVWFDMGVNVDYNDGEFDAGETPADNITIELYGVGPDNTPETADDISYGSVDTAGGGYYFFDNLYPGEYYVRIPAAEFVSGDLVGYVSTTVTGNDEITDDNTDENGIDVATLTTTGIRTRVYDLQPNDEVTAEDESNYTGVWDDDNVNFTADLSFVQLVAIGNRVWFDTGAGGGTADNGIQDGTEAGVNGVRVELHTSTGTFVDFTTTDLNGDYYFDMLNPGDYYVEIPANQFDDATDALFGYVSSTGYGIVDDDDDHNVDENGIDESDLPSNGIRTPTYTLTPDLEPVSDMDAGYSGYLDDDNVNLTADFGFLQFVAIGNRVWIDMGAGTNYNNGILDADESGIDGVTVNLYTSAGAFVDSTMTSTHLTEHGYYEFDRLLPGQYYVQIPATEFQSGNLLFDYVSTTVTGTDGTTDNNADENGIDVSTLTTTGIRTRDYDLQPNTMPTADDQVNYTGVLDNDNVNFTADLSFVQLVALGNRVWFDTGAGGGIADNGIQDGSELGVNNATIELFHVGDNPATATPVATTTTNATGDYQFDLLLTGNYFVHIPASQFQLGGALEGYVSSTNNGSDESSDQDADENGIDSTTLPADGISSTAYLLTVDGETTTDDETSYTGYLDDNNINFTADLSFLQKVAIGNRVWLDTGTGGGIADNGILDGGELGVDNVTVELYGIGADGIAGTPDDTSHGSVVTAGGGYYNFDNLLPGGYYLVISSVEFTGSEALAGYLSSTGNGADESTDELDVAGDENGIDDASPWTNGITSTTYDLQPNLERTGEPQLNYAGALDDDNVNFTADFGFQNNPQVDLGITKDDGQTYYLAGGSLTYTITVINNGPIDVTGATMSDTLPTQITSWDWACTASTGGATGCDPAIGLTTDFSDVVNLPVNATITYTVSATIDAVATGSLVNTVSVSPPGGHVDINPANDSDTDTDNPASLTITKDDGQTVVAPGAIFTYAMDITNNGVVDLSTVVVTDTLPADLSYVSAVPAPVDPNASPLVWNIGALNAAASTQVQLTVQVADPASGSSITNTVTVNDTDTGATDTDDDTDQIAATQIKTLIDTSEDDSSGSEVFIGEMLTYSISINVPDGVTMPDLRAVDVLDSGLAFDECLSISFGSLTTSRTDGFAGSCPLGGDAMLPDPAVTNSGRNLTMSFGDVTNASGSEETLTVTYLVDVLDIAANTNGVNDLNNAVQWLWGTNELSGSAIPVEIIEPDMGIEKTTDRTVATIGSIIPFTIEIYQTEDSNAHAYDVTVTDVLPEPLEYVVGSISSGSPIPYNSFDYDAVTRTITITWDFFPLNDATDPTQRAHTTITFDTLFVGPAPVRNEASLAWTSLPIDPNPDGSPVEQSEYNEDSTERWYDPTDLAEVDDYGVSSSVRISEPSLPKTGFAPNRVTSLPAQTAANAYDALSGTWIEIPKLSIELPIVGVPLRNDGWDLTWLEDQAGYLEGTAYPGLAGNTAITAHVYLPDGKPGPFVDLHTLYWGDTVILHANGQIYTYQIREKRKVWPDDASVLKHEDYDWITLITCQSFDEKNDSYQYRIAVRAVLTNVQPEE